MRDDSSNIRGGDRHWTADCKAHTGVLKLITPVYKSHRYNNKLLSCDLKKNAYDKTKRRSVNKLLLRNMLYTTNVKNLATNVNSITITALTLRTFLQDQQTSLYGSLLPVDKKNLVVNVILLPALIP